MQLLAPYSYCKCQSACADTRLSKRVFLLGPSHHLYLEKAALTRCTHYGTPLGNLPIDAETTAELYKTGQFDRMSQDVDEDEHSLEMHLPYIYKMLSRYFEPSVSIIYLAKALAGRMATISRLWSP